MKRIYSILAGLFALSASVMAQPLPTMPPANYDTGGLYTAGTVATISYYSSLVASNRSMEVYTPPGYSTSQKYGVIYAIHGIGAWPDTIFASWCCGASAVSDNLIGQGKIHGVIIVAMDDNNIDTHSELCNVIIPYIESHYSVMADADHRGIYGYSLGGGYTFNEAFGYSSGLDTFHYISPTSAANFNHPADGDMFPNGGAVAKQKMKCLFISCGTGDWDGFYPYNQATHNYCVSNNIPHGWLPVLGGGHDGGVWRPAMWNFLQMADVAGISDPIRTRSAHSQIEAENYDSQNGGSSETCSEGGLDVGSIVNGNCLVYRNVDFASGATNFQARVASATSGGNIEIHLDSTNGTLVGTCVVAGTGGWQTWTTQTNTVSGATGTHNVYLVFTGSSGYLFNVNWWTFGGPSSPVSVPSVPSGLVATAGIERTVLRWTASSTATSYNVKRAAINGGSYATIANVSGTNYTDRGLIGGTTNYYVVSALNVGGESADSSQVSVVPTVNVPSPWLTRDLGAVGVTGWASFTNGVFTVIGSGADIGSTNDEFRFVHVTTNGDCTIVARVTSASVESINPWSKAGVMIRESLATNAANVFVGVTPGNGVTFQYRSSTGGMTSSNNTSGLSAPYWVKLVRSGNTFTAYRSADGATWTQQGTTTITMASTVYIGLAVTGHDDYTLSTATFDRVTAPGWAPPYPSMPGGLVATGGIEQVSLKWLAAANATNYYVKRATTNGGPYTLVATVTSTNYNDTRLVGRTKYYYVVSAVNSLAGESDNSAQVNATPTVNVPALWMTQDIGTNGLWGGAGVTNEVFTVNGSGDDIWNTADTFRFVYLTVTNNCTVIARVVSVPNSSSWAKAGVMIRDSLNSGAANAFIAVTPGNGVTFQYRSTDGGGCNNSTTSGSAPYWVKLVCSGTNFTGYCSPNGTSWTQVGSTTTTNFSTAYIGLAVTSHNSSSLCAATFDNVSAPGWPLFLTVNAIALSSTQVGLTWNPLNNATSYNVKRSTTSGGPYANIVTGVTTTNYSDTVASVRAGYFYVVSAMIGGSETTNSPEAAVRFLKLTGGIIGTAGSWGSSGNTITNVFDGDLTTFFDGPDANGDWAGLDFGAGVSNVVAQINYCPRSGFESRMTNGIFQGANQANFSGAVTLATVATQPAAGVLTPASITNPAGFRYVRYLSPDNGFGNVAELEFYGYAFSAPSTNSPVMNLSRAGTGLTFSWPLTNSGFTLQSCTNLGGNWVNVTSAAPQMVGSNWLVSLPISASNVSIFYRLLK